MLDRVLNPASGSENIVLFTWPQTGEPIYLQRFVPTHFHNAWTIVAYALVASTVVKGIFDYAGTYLVNHAGFGMITEPAERVCTTRCCGGRQHFFKSTRQAL